MLTVVLAEMASDFALRSVDGATSLAVALWIDVVGSRIGREDVEGSCSWVAMVGPNMAQLPLKHQKKKFVTRLQR